MVTMSMMLITLDNDLYDQLQAFAKAEGMSTNDVAMLAISNYVREK